jgi:hypothetical protein
MALAICRPDLSQKSQSKRLKLGVHFWALTCDAELVINVLRKPMRSRFSICFGALALPQILGGHWALLQTGAWVGMIVQRALKAFGQILKSLVSIYKMSRPASFPYIKNTGFYWIALGLPLASIIPLAHQPVNDSERDYREAQCDDSQRGCRLNIEDNKFSCERQNADEHHRLDLYDAVKALH